MTYWSETDQLRKSKSHRLAESVRQTLRGREFTSRDLPLEYILENKDQMRMFRLFADQCMAGEALLFYMRVKEFKNMEDCPMQVLQARALNIWKNFLSAKSDTQVIISARAWKKCQETLLANEVSRNLFDDCQREAYGIVLFSIYPLYLQFLNQTKEEQESSSVESAEALEASSTYPLYLQYLNQAKEHSSSDSSDSNASMILMPQRRSVEMMADDETSDGAEEATMSPSPAPTKSIRLLTQLQLKSKSQSLEMIREWQATENYSFSLNSLTFETMMGSTELRARFRVFCETIRRTEYLVFVDKVEAWRSGGISGVVGLSIWAEFLSVNSPSSLLAPTTPSIQALKEDINRNHVSQSMFDAVRQDVLDVMRINLFPQFCDFERRSMLRKERIAKLQRTMSSTGMRAAPSPVIVVEANSTSSATTSTTTDEGGVILNSLAEILNPDSPQFAQFLKFAKSVYCDEMLLFWREVQELEAIPSNDRDAVHAKSLHIYDTYVDSLNLSSSNIKEIAFDIETGLIHMYENAKREIRQVIVQDLYARYQSHLLKEEDQSRRASLNLSPLVEVLVGRIERNCHRAKGNQGFLKHLASGSGAHDYLKHSFFETPDSQLQFLVCSAVTEMSKEKAPAAIGELQVMHVEESEGTHFAIKLFNGRHELVADCPTLQEYEVRHVVKRFVSVHENDFVTKFAMGSENSLQHRQQSGALLP